MWFRPWSWWEDRPWSATDMRGSSGGLSFCQVETLRATHAAVCWEMEVSLRGLTGTGESDLSPGHLWGRNHLSHISSIWLLLNCSAQTSIILYVAHIRSRQLSFGTCRSAACLLTLPWAYSSIWPINSFRVPWIKHGHTLNRMCYQPAIHSDYIFDFNVRFNSVEPDF